MPPAETVQDSSITPEGQRLIEHAVATLVMSLDYLEPHEVTEVVKACRFAAHAHRFDVRKSGEPYVTHPIAAAEILAKYEADSESLIAAVLHDTIEDTDVTDQDIIEAFGTSVCLLVDGVTKLKLSQDKLHNKAATFRKILTATLSDPRVMVIKLADRLHNMSTMSAVRIEKRISTANETLEFYLPFARTLGLNDLADQIELLCYQNKDPEQFAFFQAQLKTFEVQRNLRALSLISYLEAKLYRLEIQGQVNQIDNEVELCRRFFSTKADLGKLASSYRFRVLTPSVADCDAIALSVKHQYSLKPSEVQDHIRQPLPGGGQSLNMRFERGQETIDLVIQTQAMYRSSRLGAMLADSVSEQGRAVLNASLASLKQIVDPTCALTTTKDLLSYLNQEKIWVYTPSKDVIELPKGATVLDFAYAVSPMVGNHAVAATRDHEPCSLASKLQNGQMIQIKVDPLASASAEWLGFLVTKKARRALQGWLTTQSEEEQVQGGKDALRRALKQYGLGMDLSEAEWQDLLDWQQIEDKNVIYQRIATGDLLPQLVVSRLKLAYPNQDLDSEPLIEGTQGVELLFGNCCNPIFGDPIYGHLTRSGTVAHRRKCHMIARALEKHPHQVLELNWQSNAQQAVFHALIYIEAKLGPDMISKLVQRLKQAGVGMDKLVHTEKGAYMLLSVLGRDALAHAIASVRSELGFPSVRRLYEFDPIYS